MALKFKSGVCATAALLWLASASAQEPGHGPGGDRGGGDPQRGGGPGGCQAIRSAGRARQAASVLQQGAAKWPRPAQALVFPPELATHLSL